MRNVTGNVNVNIKYSEQCLKLEKARTTCLEKFDYDLTEKTAETKEQKTKLHFQNYLAGQCLPYMSRFWTCAKEHDESLKNQADTGNSTMSFSTNKACMTDHQNIIECLEKLK